MVLLVGACAGPAAQPIVVRREDAPRTVNAPDAGPAATSWTDRGRVFFGRNPKQIDAIAVEELFVAVGADGKVVARLGWEMVEGATLAGPDLIEAHRTGSTLSLHLYSDGSFDGA